MGLRAWSHDNSITKSNLPFEHVKLARNVLLHQSRAIERVGKNIPADFSLATDLILHCQGAVIVTGMGKAGWIGQKVSASLASTGTPSHFLHPAEAIHGDLGRVQANDVIVVLSNSGETAEIVSVLPRLEALGVEMIAITARLDSTLARQATAVLNYGTVEEAGHLGLAPSTSTTVMLALGDALTLAVSRLRAFREIDFARFHPGGSLGRKLCNVTEVMRPIADCRIGIETETVRNLYINKAGAKRRSGVVMLVDDSGKLTGIFTDSDLARLLECQQDDLFDGPVQSVMTCDPITIHSSHLVSAAIEVLGLHNISELPVIDSQGRPIGLIDITDIVNL